MQNHICHLGQSFWVLGKASKKQLYGGISQINLEQGAGNCVEVYSPSVKQCGQMTLQPRVFQQQNLKEPTNILNRRSSPAR